MDNKAIKKNNIKNEIGWCYNELKWLTDDGVLRANKIRNKLINSISKSILHSYSGSKLHIGALSPGCAICADGLWSCVFINSKCTRSCFFCPQERQQKTERMPIITSIDTNLLIADPNIFIKYLKRFGFKGLSFTGGECLLAFDKLEYFIRKTKKYFGDNLYVWIYTNGDLIDKKSLQSLEMRISMRYVSISILANTIYTQSNFQQNCLRRSA